MELRRLNKRDGSWAKLETDWRAECDTYGEDFESYAEASLSTLRDECDDDTVDPSSGVFGLYDDEGRLHAACFLNSTFLPSYTGKVLRVRHFVLSPYYDFEPLDLEDYAIPFAAYFVALVECSERILVSQHIKIHYRSPYDRQFFAAFGMQMRSTGRFSTVESKGMWLYLSKSS
jgi:hypothetical protein